MIRIAAIGDVHFGVDSAGLWAPHWDALDEQADVLLLAGDLSRRGLPEEAVTLRDELHVELPVVAVLGNHDLESNRQDEFRRVLVDAGIHVLEGESITLDVRGQRLGIAGTIGFVGGFPGGLISSFGEPELKQLMARTRSLADGFESALAALDVDVRVGLLHYAPVRDTVVGEPAEIHAFLGSHLFGQAADRAGADLLVHGHAHHGSERGLTPGGIPVRNVAHPLVGVAYRVFEVAGAPQRVAEPTTTR